MHYYLTFLVYLIFLHPSAQEFESFGISRPCVIVKEIKVFNIFSFRCNNSARISREKK
jgi:hypothetical protein